MKIQWKERTNSGWVTGAVEMDNARAARMAVMLNAGRIDGWIKDIAIVEAECA